MGRALTSILGLFGGACLLANVNAPTPRLDIGEKSNSSPRPTKEMLNYALQRASGEKEKLVVTCFVPGTNGSACDSDVFSRTAWSKAIPYGKRDKFGYDAHIFMFLNVGDFSGQHVKFVFGEKYKEPLLINEVDVLDIGRRKDLFLYMGQMSVPCYAADVRRKNEDLGVRGVVEYEALCFSGDRLASSNMFSVDYGNKTEEVWK